MVDDNPAPRIAIHFPSVHRSDESGTTVPVHFHDLIDSHAFRAKGNAAKNKNGGASGQSPQQNGILVIFGEEMVAMR